MGKGKKDEDKAFTEALGEQRSAVPTIQVLIPVANIRSGPVTKRAEGLNCEIHHQSDAETRTKSAQP